MRKHFISSTETNTIQDLQSMRLQISLEMLIYAGKILASLEADLVDKCEITVCIMFVCVFTNDFYTFSSVLQV